MIATSLPPDTDRDGKTATDSDSPPDESGGTDGFEASTLSWLGALAVVLVGVALYRLVGLPGILVGVVLALCWYYLSAEATVAVGTLLSVVALPGDPSLAGLAFLACGLLAVLASAAFRYDAPLRLLGAFLAFLLVLLVVTWVGAEQGGATWFGVLALLLTGSILAYGHHRYLLVRTGRVESGGQRPGSNEGAGQ